MSLGFDRSIFFLFVPAKETALFTMLKINLLKKLNSVYTIVQRLARKLSQKKKQTQKTILVSVDCLTLATKDSDKSATMSQIKKHYFQ